MRFHGVNLSGWLSLEPWVTPELFAEAGALSEAQLIRSLGVGDYARVVQEHRQAFITRQDFASISSRGFSACRIPVPWYVFGAAGVAPGPYVGCIDYLDQAFEWAEEFGIKLTLALAIRPGHPAENDVIARDPADLSTEYENLLNLIAALSKRYRAQNALWAIEIADSVRLDRFSLFGRAGGVSSSELFHYYRGAYECVCEFAGESCHVVFPDAEATGRLAAFIARENMIRAILDIEPSSRFTHAAQNAPGAVRKMVSELTRRLGAAERAGVKTMVGKWSSSLPFADVATTPEGRLALERLFASSQIAAFEASEAWFFQTWKTSARLSAWDARIALSSFEKGMLL